jgi:hypothetical protein
MPSRELIQALRKHLELPESVTDQEIDEATKGSYFRARVALAMSAQALVGALGRSSPAAEKAFNDFGAACKSLKDKAN